MDPITKGNHVAWKWPEDGDWTWCNDRYRKTGPKSLPREPRSAGGLPAVPPVPPTTGADRTLLLRLSWSCLDFREQDAVVAASKVLGSLHGVKHKQFTFDQHDYYWLWHNSENEPVKVSCICTFVASQAAASFYEDPSQVTMNWRVPDVWQAIHSLASDLHKHYVKACILPNSDLAPRGSEAFYCSPVEYAAHFDKLMRIAPNEFRTLRKLFGPRALVDLTRKCEKCHQVCHYDVLPGPTTCATCKVQVPSEKLCMRDCFKRILEDVDSRGQGHAYVCIVGGRTFFLCVHDDLCVAHDSHKRTWSGQPEDGSSCLSVALPWIGERCLQDLSQIWCRGELGYKLDDEAGVWTWGKPGSRTPETALIVDADAARTAPAPSPSSVAGPGTPASSMTLPRNQVDCPISPPFKN